MKVLVTGFGAFPGVESNPTETVVRRLTHWNSEKSCDLHAHVLPTEYKRASRKVVELISVIDPDVCLCCGVAGPGAFRLETVARNEDVALYPDNIGFTRTGVIIPEG